MAAKQAVLGLVIERPGYGYQLAQRLAARLGSFAFAPSGVYAALEQLAREGLVDAGAPGDAPRARRTYRATRLGERSFEAWMLGSSPTPALRDDLHMKIALCRPRDLPRLLENVHGQELACRARLRELRLATPSARAGQDWVGIARRLAGETEVALWEARLQWLEIAGARLKESHAQLLAQPLAPAAACP